VNVITLSDSYDCLSPAIGLRDRHQVRSNTWMQARGAAALVATLLVAAAADASAPRSVPGGLRADAMTAMPAAGVAKPLRAQRDVRWSAPASAAWSKLAATGAWHAAWDRATGVPNRIWGSGIAAPGAMASAEVAERVARAMLAEHIALLAPGASPADFVLVSNSSDGDVRSVGFLQTYAGRPVVGGQVSFRFKRDRLFVIGSEALPGVALPLQVRTQTRMSTAAFRDRTTAALRRQLDLADAPVTPPGDEVVLPLVGDDAVLGYRAAVPVTIDGGARGRYLAYGDPATGEILAVQQMNLYDTATLLYHAVNRYPALPRHDLPAPRAHITLDGIAQTTSSAGDLTLPDAGTHMLTTAVVGDLVTIVNKGTSGALATAQLSAAPGAQIVWDPSGVIEDDAQVQVYLNVNHAKDFARTLDPQLATLDMPIVANVNINQDCNAFFDGRSVNFFHASTRCENTGRIQDVVFHEFGHSVHTAEIMPGVGAFDGAMSEGAADFFAVQITEDPGMGRGFFYNDTPLRDLDPPSSEARWPQDIGEIHKTGMIFGSAFWDLRKALIALDMAHPEVGKALAQKLFVGTLRTATGISTSLVDVLQADDNDGNLDNGTPNECAIRDAWGRHGLRTATGVIQAPDRLAQTTLAATVRIELSDLATRCDGDKLDHVELAWQPSTPDDPPAAGKVTAVKSAETEFFAELPLAADTTVLYQATIVFLDGSVLTLPNNLADPYYQVYEGRTVPLYCTDFESDPFAAGWTTGTNDSSPSPWVWGVPSGGATDPHAAYSGSHALVQALDGDYGPKSSSYVRMPRIDIGAWSDVHLQYRRWLAVEDSHFDQARITVGGQQAWINFSENMGDASSTQHLDREWRFQDVPLSGYQLGHSLDIAWELTSDEGLQFGGWALDDLCVVANVNSVCGDGVISPHEQCDDGPSNADVPDACRTYCRMPSCGDKIVDRGEECDTGPLGDGDCTEDCKLVKPPSLGGCCSATRGAGGSWALAAAVLGLVLRRRRR
jgi:cysteine-rich repeat protein